MRNEWNTELLLNGKKIFIDENDFGNLYLKLFIELLDYSNTLICGGDDGEDFGIKKLMKFVISKDKDFGDMHFEVNKDSKYFLLKLFISRSSIYKELNWESKGKDFSVIYDDC